MAEKRQPGLMSSAGLVRYFDEGEVKIHMKPEHIIWISVAFAGFILLIKFLV